VDFDRDAAHTQQDDGFHVRDGVLRLDPSLKAPALARQFLQDHRDHLPGDLLTDAEVVVSEVVTNAVRYGLGAILLRVRATPPGIGIAVSDEGPPIPAAKVKHPTAPAGDAAHGRGLLIIDALASAWGVVPHDSPPGKTVWIELRST
jgi:anti-sigma regulatory factor (Ser/Thr protein kinase)